jgi:hypothetical protein
VLGWLGGEEGPGPEIDGKINLNRGNQSSRTRFGDMSNKADFTAGQRLLEIKTNRKYARIRKRILNTLCRALARTILL